jgi:predicted TIM-barrel fold metal-dependent hydrolase
MNEPVKPPEHNVNGHDYSRRDHFTYTGPPIIDFHAHVTMTDPEDKSAGPAGGWGEKGTSNSAAMMLEVGDEFGIDVTVSMCPPQDIAPLRQRLGRKLVFNAMINKKAEDGEEVAFRTLDQFLEAGVKVIKLWSAPRGRERGLVVDAPWRIESLKRAYKAGVRIAMVHVGDPDVWWTHTYQDTAKFGTKPSQYEPFARMIELFPEFTWVGAHMGGDPEHPDHLEAMLERFPNLHFDTSATKWQVREVSPRAEAVRAMIVRHPTRFLFGTDLVTRHGLTREHYVSRYWCQRTLWESTWVGPSPIADPDYTSTGEAGQTPTLRGIGLPQDVLLQVYAENARRLLNLGE